MIVDLDLFASALNLAIQQVPPNLAIFQFCKPIPLTRLLPLRDIYSTKYCIFQECYATGPPANNMLA